VSDFVGGSNVIEPGLAAHLGVPDGTYSLRPERIAILPEGAPAPHGQRTASASVTAVLYQGAARRVQVELAGMPLNAVVPSEGPPPAPGSPVEIAFDPAALHRMGSPTCVSRPFPRRATASSGGCRIRCSGGR